MLIGEEREGKQLFTHAMKRPLPMLIIDHLFELIIAKKTTGCKGISKLKM